jgi:hypothetical protein
MFDDIISSAKEVDGKYVSMGVEATTEQFDEIAKAYERIKGSMDATVIANAHKTARIVRISPLPTEYATKLIDKLGKIHGEYDDPLIDAVDGLISGIDKFYNEKWGAIPILEEILEDMDDLAKRDKSVGEIRDEVIEKMYGEKYRTFNVKEAKFRDPYADDYSYVEVAKSIALWTGIPWLIKRGGQWFYEIGKEIPDEIMHAPPSHFIQFGAGMAAATTGKLTLPLIVATLGLYQPIQEAINGANNLREIGTRALCFAGAYVLGRAGKYVFTGK